MQSRKSCQNEDSSVDTLFLFEEEPLAYIKFQRLVHSTLSKVSISSVFRLDVVTIDAVDSLGSLIGKHSNKEEKTIDGVSRIDSIGSSDGKKVTDKKVSKDRTIPQEFAARLRSLLPAAATQFLDHTKNCFAA